MLSNRHQLILDYLKTHKLATVDDLIIVTGVSPATVRRDLLKLDAEGLVYRVHGSVSALEPKDRQPTTSEKSALRHEQKLRIAKAASELINAGDSVLLDAGTTTIEIAKLIQEMPLKIITTDLNIGILLAAHRQIDLSLTGGTVDWSSQSCIGDLARSVLSKIHPMITFISCNAWDLKTGITAPTVEKANLKSDLMHSKAKRVLVADSSKYGKSQLFEVADLKAADLIITDSELDEDIARQIREQGINLLTA